MPAGRGRNTTAPPGAAHSGWYRDGVNALLEWYHNGTKVGQASGSAVTMSGAVTNTGVTTAAAELRVNNGFNIRLGGHTDTFASTEPTNALVMKVGTNPAGAITTSGAIFITTGGATISKIIAANTVSQIEA